MTLEKAWNHKEAIYMNLSDGIRYCTMLPSIETYNVGNHPSPVYSSTPSAIDTYTVAEFATDVMTEKIRAPFASEQRKKAISRRSRNTRAHTQTSSESNSSDEKNDALLEKKFDELFGANEED